MSDVKISYSTLFRKLRDADKSLSDSDYLLNFLKADLGIFADEEVKKQICRFCRSLCDRWQCANRTEKTFLSKYESWLENEMIFPPNPQPEDVCMEDSPQPSCSNASSTPSKSFETLGERQKRRRTSGLRNENSLSELLHASKTLFNEAKDFASSKVLSVLMECPEKAKEIVAFLEGKVEQKSTLSKERALATFVALNLSKRKYERMRVMSIQDGHHVFPSYYQIRLAKNECYPPKSSIKISETCAEIDLQALLDHTVRRILKVIGCDKVDKELKLITKWGMDGSGQNAFKQKFTEEGKDKLTKPPDSSIFATHLVPLRLLSANKLIWENPRPSSTFFCRPCRFEFVQESDEIIKTEYKRMTQEIGKLSPTQLNGSSVQHELICSMIDGKVCNSLTDCSSTLRCYICGATSAEFNDLEKIYDKPVKEENYQFGLSTLHAWIRFMEFLLKLAYKLGTKKWHEDETKKAPKKRGVKKTKEEREEEAKLKKEKAEQHRKELEAKKLEIQEKFREKLGILVDFVKQGHGSTNDGNCARKFFENPSLTAEITGIEEEVVKRLKIILQVLVSGKEIDPDKYDAYARETAAIYVKIYNKCNLSPTVHKVLTHGAGVIRKALVPIGTLSEEASEATHKELKKFRSERARGINRVACNEDVLHALLIKSDPFISSLRYNSSNKKKSKVLDPEATELLISDLHEDSGVDLDESILEGLAEKRDDDDVDSDDVEI